MKFLKDLFDTGKHTTFVNFILRALCFVLILSVLLVLPVTVSVLLGHTHHIFLVEYMLSLFLSMVFPITVMLLFALGIESSVYNTKEKEEDKKVAEEEEKQQQQEKQRILDMKEFVQDLLHMAKIRKKKTR